MSNPPLIYTPDTPSSSATDPASLILMHGLGSNADDLFSLAPHLADGQLRVICPNAPTRPITINAGMTMQGWYDIDGVDLESRQDKKGVAQSTTLINELIAEEIKQGTPAHRIFLGGFSQGAAMALHVGLRYPETLAGIIAIAGYLLFAEEITAGDPILSPANRQTPIWQAHGSFDPVVLPIWAQRSRDILQTNGYSLTYHEYGMAHTIANNTIADLNDWLALHINQPQ